MEYRTRDGQNITGNDKQDRFLARLYGTHTGRACVKVLIAPEVSELGGRLLSSHMSRVFIRPFIRRNGIDMSQYERKKYRSYNDFFTRQVKPEMRPVDETPSHLVSPCDGKLSAYTVCEEGKIRIKGTDYTVASLLRDRNLAARYIGGTALVFRLTIDDYHRFLYIDEGEVGDTRTIEGVYHTINPAAGKRYPIYKENHRDCTVLETEHFGPVTMIEVGALMVGRIVNHPSSAPVARGMEKGYFEFGGSTIVLLFEKSRIVVDNDILLNSRSGIETIVKAGEKIGMMAPSLY